MILINRIKKTLLLKGSFKLKSSIIKLAYSGVEQNTKQKFKITSISVNITLSDTKIVTSISNTYNPISTIDEINNYSINYESFNIPNNFNLNTIQLDSLKIQINCVYNNNILQSFINYKITNPNVSIENLTTTINYPVTPSKSILPPSIPISQSESNNQPGSSYLHIYILVIVSILICIIVYIMYNYKKSNDSSEVNDLIESLE
jgi:hypothetical protein